jgi:hypothetical protein
MNSKIFLAAGIWAGCDKDKRLIAYGDIFWDSLQAHEYEFWEMGYQSHTLYRPTAGKNIM